ncbi:hypothetical protein SM124_08190 [Bacillus sp. 31A1R]|uniref:Uncharacterized protein n=1 Tax=Robertmurraya mangrovi TaxID=3098077 RepID=A0ABU5IX30_9BACI|nr:hypothetical protein [Bacillus sp. 31A1R]MDZ5471724.1 hypothetical protein [Bacillus sp. 31A1R]
MKKILALTLFDLKYVFRDFMLIVSIVAPIFLAILFGYGIPLVSVLIEERFGFDLMAYTDLLTIVLYLPYLLCKDYSQLSLF